MLKKYTLVLTVFILSFYTLLSLADNDWFKGKIFGKRGVAKVTNKLYLEECGSCHFAYQPGLLPARSWRKMMSQNKLEDHFGDNIEFEDRTKKELLSYMVSNAADRSKYKRSRKIMRSLRRNQAPLRITDTPYIRRKHSDIPRKLITQTQVGSIGNCEACHKSASSGSYDDDNVKIPNSRRRQWDHD